ncbi:MAG: hypothetical protein R3E68_02605 [Burkholderiaceae bacterium]
MSNPSPFPAIVDPTQVGVVWPFAHPGSDPVLYGHVDLSPRGAFEVRSAQTFTMTYTVGRHGIDDTFGSIRVVSGFSATGARCRRHGRPTMAMSPQPAAAPARLR